MAQGFPVYLWFCWFPFPSPSLPSFSFLLLCYYEMDLISSIPPACPYQIRFLVLPFGFSSVSASKKHAHPPLPTYCLVWFQFPTCVTWTPTLPLLFLPPPLRIFLIPYCLVLYLKKGPIPCIALYYTSYEIPIPLLPATYFHLPSPYLHCCSLLLPSYLALYYFSPAASSLPCHASSPRLNPSLLYSIYVSPKF